MSSKIKYPSLYADVEPATLDHKRGSVVRCTATRVALGFVWWEAVGGTTVVWHFTTTAGTLRGQRMTERQAVQALRDEANAALRNPDAVAQDRSAIEADLSASLRERAARPATVKRATVTPKVIDRTPSPQQPRRPSINWDAYGSGASATDLRDTMAAGIRDRFETKKGGGA